MPSILTHALNHGPAPASIGPVEQLTRIHAGFAPNALGQQITLNGSGFFDPKYPGFMVTSAHNLGSAAGARTRHPGLLETAMNDLERAVSFPVQFGLDVDCHEEYHG